MGMRAPSWEHSSRKLVPGRAGGPGRTSRSIRGADGVTLVVISVRRLQNWSLGIGKKGSWGVDHAAVDRRPRLKDVQYRHAQALRHKTDHTFTVLLNTLTTTLAAV
jgi:hypothetical protein